LILALLLLAFAVRVHALGEQAVWWDEAWSVMVAQADFSQTTEITARDVHPPLYQWALHAWVRGVGISEFAVRYLSLLWGMITIATIGAIAHRIAGDRAMIWSLGAAALSTFLITWSQETRMYAQAAGFCALASYAALTVRTDVEDRAHWLLLIGAGIGVALTHYLGALALAILNLHVLITLRGRTSAFQRRWIASMVIIGIVWLTWVIYAYPLTRSGSIADDFSPLLAFQLAATLYAVGTSINLGDYGVFAVMVSGCFAIGVALFARYDRRSALLIALMAVIPPLTIYLLSILDTRFYSPKPEERYFIIFAPLVYVGIGVAIDQFYRLNRVIGIALILGGVGLYGVAYLDDHDQRYYRDDYATLFRAIHALARPDEPILFVSDDRYPLVYYHLNRAAGWQTPLQIVPIPAPEHGFSDDRMEALIGSAERFWVVEIEQHFRDPQGFTTAWFAARYPRLYGERITYNGFTLYGVPRPLTDAPMIPPVIDQARPGDIARIGGAGPIHLWYEDTPILTDSAEQWRIVQFPIFGAYPNGGYQFEHQGAFYPFRVTEGNRGGAPSVSRVLDFGDLRLTGYHVQADRIRPGETFVITLYWQVDQRPTRNYTVFAQLLSGLTVIGNDDRYPADTPTTALWPGLSFTGEHRLRIDVAGTYQAAFGLYDLETGERFKTPDGQDMLIIEGLRVE
jgi:4-amino-4-deoxy-L-arabinose transferase-like glycosyltransferase